MGLHNALPPVTMDCKNCGKQFTVPGSKALAYACRKGRARRYCSVECYTAGRKIPVPTFECACCGKQTPYRHFKFKDGRVGSYDRSQRFCSRSCARKTQVMPKGHGKGWVEKNGYRVIRKDEEGRDILEHRDVMERALGRKLLPEETVHHKNGVRTDNKLKNLELWSSRHGRGQRVCDKIDFAVAFLRDYGIGVAGFTESEAISGIAGLN